jgi:hypothetical protein
MATTRSSSTETRSRRRDSGSSERRRPRSGRASTSRERRSGDPGSRSITAKNVTAQERTFLAEHASQLSPTTLRAKWIHSPDEHEDRSGQSLATRSDDVIRAWADQRGAKPATVRSRQSDQPRTLRFDFPGYGGGRLEPIDWEAWLGTFKRRKLVFLFQEHKRDGSESNFFRLDSPEREEG